jgi:hypothetical protein
VPSDQEQTPADSGYRRHPRHAVSAAFIAACGSMMDRASRTVHRKRRGIVGHVHVCGLCSPTQRRGASRLDAHPPKWGVQNRLTEPIGFLVEDYFQMRFNVTTQVSMAKWFQEISVVREVSSAR